MQYQEFLGEYLGTAKGLSEFSREQYAVEEYRPQSYLWELWTGSVGYDKYKSAQKYYESLVSSLAYAGSDYGLVWWRTSREGWGKQGKWLWESEHLQMRADQHGNEGEPHINTDLKARNQKAKKGKGHILGGAHWLELDV